MPAISTRCFGELQYDAEGVFEFPGGMPGFEDHQRFLFIEQPHTHPLVFMQSLHQPELCFISAPVSVADPKYALELTSEERAALDLPEDAESGGARDVVCLGLITTGHGASTTINLASPIVLNLRSRKGVQAVRDEAEYSLRHPLAREEAVPCS